ALNNKSDSIPFEVPGECARRDQHRPFDPTAVPQLETPPQISADGERQLEEQGHTAPKQGCPNQVQGGGAAINPSFQIFVQPLVLVSPRRLSPNRSPAFLERCLGKLKRQSFSDGLHGETR